MKRLKIIGKILPAFLLGICVCCQSNPSSSGDEVFTTFTVHPQEANVQFFSQDDAGEYLKSIRNLKKYVERDGKKLRFAMNGGMYQEDQKPLGLFIRNQKTVMPLNTREAKGNFYIKPNGVFYITVDKKAFVAPTQDFQNDGQVNFATQSGPMLLVDGSINQEFTPNSDNLNIRNGVCITEDGKIIFAISRIAVNFYDFATHFKKAGCRNALYLDGYVSRMYLPEKNVEQLDGDFGIIIGIVN